MSDAGDRRTIQFIQNWVVTGNVSTGPNYGSMNQIVQTSPATGNNGILLPQNSVVGRSSRTWRLSILAVVHNFLFPISFGRREHNKRAGRITIAPMSPPSRSHGPAAYDIYVRSLLKAGHGLPCWEPKPLDPAAQPKGVVPGDVGTYTVEGGFRRSFNLFEDARAICEISRTIHGDTQNQGHGLGRQVMHHRGILGEGENLVRGASADRPGPPNPRGPVYEFRRDSSAPAGAVLALTSSADQEETADIDGMEEYIHEHAEAIYRHANRIRRIRADESIYIVTGCIKSDSWAIAAYSRGMDKRNGGTLRLEPDPQFRSGSLVAYEWTRSCSSRTRVGRSEHRGVKDQSLFLRGFKLAFSKRFRSRVKASEPRANGSDSSRSEGGSANDPNSQNYDGTRDQGPNGGDSSEGGFGTKNDTGKADQSGTQRCTSCLDSDVPPSASFAIPGTNDASKLPGTPSVYEIDGSPHVYHPSDVINTLLLQQTNCEIAVCHDNAWSDLLKLCHSVLPDNGDTPTLEVLSEKIGQSGNRIVGTDKGVAFLLPDGCEAAQSEPTSTFKEVGVTDKTHIETLAEHPAFQADEVHKKQAEGEKNVEPQEVPPPHPDTVPPLKGSKAFVALAPPLLPTDIVVLVMGLVGAGRSTFINALLPSHVKYRMTVGTNLDACTTKANCAILDPDDLAPILGRKPGYRLVLVDTPGFDSGYKSDSEGVLSEIIIWSKAWLPDGHKLRGGIIFLHDLSADRFQGRGDLVAVSSIFAPEHVVVVTSKWRNVPNIPGPLPEGDRRHGIIEKQITHAKIHKLKEEQKDAPEIMKNFLPVIEEGDEMDFEKAFKAMKAEKRKAEKWYKKKAKVALTKLVDFFTFWRRTVDAS